MMGFWRIRKLMNPFPRVARFTVDVRDFGCLKTALGWTRDPVLDEPYLFEYARRSDINERRMRDAEVIAGACCNGNPEILLEIGTAAGQTTTIMAMNAPKAAVYTVNIPPEQIRRGGKLVTYAPKSDEIGSYYRSRGCSNIHQILANTSDWQPDFGPIDVSFIDGCHDAKFVFNDTAKVLKYCRPGSILIWHDFCPELALTSFQKANVCAGIEKLFRKRILRGPIYHLRDSWVGLMVVEEQYAGMGIQTPGR